MCVSIRVLPAEFSAPLPLPAVLTGAPSTLPAVPAGAPPASPTIPTGASYNNNAQRVATAASNVGDGATSSSSSSAQPVSDPFDNLALQYPPSEQNTVESTDLCICASFLDAELLINTATRVDDC